MDLFCKGKQHALGKAELRHRETCLVDCMLPGMPGMPGRASDFC